ncbi:MAG: flagellin [Bdellovibrionales bacterium RIFOXYD12_FULL_39_22]|nr:MAG: flagellin [Bdellovibrionales bacterium RIFOXYB1_FULL_39_21]OFZ45024.1 MAG: flagellin [Bdellovibrionales bacterium RIFOXYC12_FULL_39_17]OFZ49462.1 MAG: flagellin [Bdellovibrionales bacterium RIFOXYC1_FULL_39_130]OFZ77201.1 MAG: flagellin [Bdellovibrionales bacterium RIFOXYD1_FULL_39_84]OFZ95646.1 MAG: flagellin [Bdellovibrionales bacterium RIFOXYD12_FULL_39_22]HLE11160.1 flagellin [Bacteriovoracaceae bacterium]
MGLRINTNVTSLSAQRTLGVNSADQERTLSKLSSGTRIVRAADDAAGLAISEKLKAQIRGVTQAGRNANDGISLIQTAEGGMNEISNILIRLRELSIQSASDTVGDAERQFTNLEYQNLKQEIERISQVTEFNGKKLLNGTGESYDFQIGINNDSFQDRIRYNAGITNSTMEGLGVASLSVSSKEESQGSLAVLDDAIQKISGQRAELGAVQNRLSSTIQNLQVSSENLNAANSRIRDTDYAAETAQNTRLNIMTQAGTSVLAQANSQGSAALKLIG